MRRLDGNLVGLLPDAEGEIAITNRLLFSWLWVSLLAPSGAVLACEYTVRDVAFVELGDRPYRLVIHRPDAQPRNSMLADSNVRLEVVPGNTATATLISPTDNRLSLPDLAEDELTAWAVNSPKRTEILSACLETYGAVVLIERTDAEQNRAARELAEKGIRYVNNTLEFLPKAIEKPPRLVVIPQQETERERVLLWCLGVAEKANRPHLAVVMGRGRRVGPVLDASKATLKALTSLLSIVGMDCECDLDRAVMRAPMFPHTWTATDEQRAVKHLRFDPGNPLVQAEISRILAKGPSKPNVDRPKSNTLGTLGSGYQELDLDEPDQPDEPDGPTSELVSKPDVATPPANTRTRPETPSSEPESTANPVSTIGYVLAGLAGVALLGGALVFFLVRRGG